MFRSYTNQRYKNICKPLAQTFPMNPSKQLGLQPLVHSLTQNTYANTLQQYLSRHSQYFHTTSTPSHSTRHFHTTQNTPKMENYTAHIVHQIYCSHAKHFDCIDNISTYPTDKSTHLNNISDEQYLSQHINDMSQPVRTIKCIASIRIDEFYFIKIKYS